MLQETRKGEKSVSEKLHPPVALFLQRLLNLGKRKLGNSTAEVKLFQVNSVSAGIDQCLLFRREARVHEICILCIVKLSLRNHIAQ